MPILIHDHTTLAAFDAVSGPEEIRGPAGRLVGHFVPPTQPGFISEFGVTVEELNLAINDPNTKWVTPEDVMARLREIDRCSS